MLVDDASLVPSAVEEILRWTSIVIQFQRTAVEDVELRGKTIRKGESVVLWYPSANRDEDVFEDPYKFDIRRDPNDHFAVRRLRRTLLSRCKPRTLGNASHLPRTATDPATTRAHRRP